MKAFEYASPETEREALEFLSPEPGKTALLAGGTDLIGLMSKMITQPERVVSLAGISSLRAIEVDARGVSIGSMMSLEDVAEHPATAAYPALRQAIGEISSQQLQSQGTLGGELCQRPRCWYFRSGEGLLAREGQSVVEGDNRYHAIFGNAGPAKFVCPSRLAPALIALGAAVRVIGPDPDNGTIMPLEAFFRTPEGEHDREHALRPDQILSHVLLPVARYKSAAYEVRQGSGPDYPLAAAAAALAFQGGTVSEARIVLGQVAPTPWISREAIQAIVGCAVNEDTAEAAGRAAASVATPLSHNEYKVQLAKVAVKRAILLAAGFETGGF
jgi:xanthine dehydrogenase YagS FAD-binding subunit